MNEYTFDDLQPGMHESFLVRITEDMEDAFRNMTGDVNPLHKDDTYAYEIGEGKFRGHISFGMLTASFYSTLVGVWLPGKYSLIHSLDIKFQKPVYEDDELTITGEIIEKQEALRLIIINAEIRNQNRQIVSKAKIKVLVLK